VQRDGGAHGLSGELFTPFDRLHLNLGEFQLYDGDLQKAREFINLFNWLLGG
jgi:hypothetical protein